MSDDEKLELLDLLLGGEKPPVLVGPVNTLPAAPLGVAVLNGNGGVAVQAVQPHTEVLLKKYLGIS